MTGREPLRDIFEHIARQAQDWIKRYQREQIERRQNGPPRVR